MSRLKRKVERLRKKLEKVAQGRGRPPGLSRTNTDVDVRVLAPEKCDRLEALLVLACGPGARSEPDLDALTDPERRELYALMDAATSGPQPPPA